LAYCEFPYETGWTKGTNRLKFLPIEKANAIADCLENRRTAHDLCNEGHEERVEACVQALLEAKDNTATESQAL
jgi:hypothetical protein